jgi:hypothetical protein
LSALLLVHGGDDAARAVMARERRLYWTAAFGLVLEKRGYLDYAERGVSVLDDPAALGRHPVVVVGRLPEELWTPARIAALRAFPGEVVLEAPFPREVAALVGIRSSEPAGDGWLAVGDARLEAALDWQGRALGQVHRVKQEAAATVDPSLSWDAIGVPIAPHVAAAWRRDGWDTFRWTVESDAEVVADWVDDRGRSAGIVRRGRLTALCGSLLGQLAHAQTASPWPRGTALRTYDATAVEDLVLALLDDALARAGVVRARVLPWPHGRSWALTVRHDFDRPLPPEAVAAVLRGHDGVGTSATWYWRARHLVSRRMRLGYSARSSVMHAVDDHPGPPGWTWPARRRAGREAVRLVARHPCHEVALPTELPWLDAGEEQRVVERVAGARVRGSSAHGDARCFRFQGAANLLWAHRTGLLYTENIQNTQHQPYRAPAPEPDGRMGALRVLCLPRHHSLDMSTSTSRTRAAEIGAASAGWPARGSLAQVMNHPDINVPALLELLGSLPREDRHDCTAAEAARWWQATHVRGGLALTTTAGGAVEARSPERIAGLGIELRHPDGSRTTRVVDLEPGAPATIYRPRRAASA